MNNQELAYQYQYIWDGSQSGWVLTKMNGDYVVISLVFSNSGPSAREAMAVRRAVQEYKSLPLHMVIARLCGRASLPLGRFESKEARAIAAACRAEGLQVTEEVDEVPEFLLTNESKGRALLIEDDELAQQVCRLALLYGVPVRHIER